MCESVTTFEHLKLLLCKNRPNTQVKVLLSVLFLFSPAEPVELHLSFSQERSYLKSTQADLEFLDLTFT